MNNLIKKKYKSMKFNDLERQSIFVERKLAMPTVHKDRKKFDKKRERQLNHDIREQ